MIEKIFILNKEPKVTNYLKEKILESAKKLEISTKIKTSNDTYVKEFPADYNLFFIHMSDTYDGENLISLKEKNPKLYVVGMTQDIPPTSNAKEVYNSLIERGMYDEIIYHFYLEREEIKEILENIL